MLVLRGLLLVTAILFWGGCTSAEKIYLAEKLTFPADYIHAAHYVPRAEPGYWEGQNKEIHRQIALYVFHEPQEAKRQAEALHNGKPAVARSVTGEHPTIASNRAVACLLLGDYTCAEEELLKAGLNGDERIRHNFRVVLKLQEDNIVIYK